MRLLRKVVLLCVASVGLTYVAAGQNADPGQYRVARGLAVYIGLVPSGIVRGHLPTHPERTMHGGPTYGSHDYHLVAAAFDAATGARVSDAKVSAGIAGLGLGAKWTRLEPMQMAGAMSYGAFVTFPGADRYTIQIEIVRDGSDPVRLDFPYQHGR